MGNVIKISFIAFGGFLIFAIGFVVWCCSYSMQQLKATPVGTVDKFARQLATRKLTDEGFKKDIKIIAVQPGKDLKNGLLPVEVLAVGKTDEDLSKAKVKLLYNSYQLGYKFGFPPNAQLDGLSLVNTVDLPLPPGMAGIKDLRPRKN